MYSMLRLPIEASLSQLSVTEVYPKKNIDRENEPWLSISYFVKKYITIFLNYDHRQTINSIICTALLSSLGYYVSFVNINEEHLKPNPSTMRCQKVSFVNPDCSVIVQIIN